MIENPGKRVLILWADHFSANLGVRALASGVESLVREIWPNAEIVCHNFGTRTQQLPSGRVRSLVRERITGERGTREWLSNFDLVIDTRAGDSFSDIYGLRRHRVMSAVAEFAVQAGTPIVLAPQTIGPFATMQGRMLARRSLKTASASMARDSSSAVYARSIGRPVDLQTTDVVFSLSRPDVRRSRDVILNISGLLWQDSPHVSSARYRELIADMYARLTAEGRVVTLLAHVLDSAVSDNDVPAIREFAEATGAEAVIPVDLWEVRDVVASAEVVIGSRMHACLNALSVGTPSIPLAYSRKFEPLLTDLGWHRTVDLRTDPDPVKSTIEFLAEDGLAVDAAQLAERARKVLAPVPALLASAV